MSDLQCAATLLLARHGEAEYDTVLLGDVGGSLSLTGRAQARDLGRSLRGARVSMIYCSSMARAVQTAEIIAAELGVVVRVRDDLREWSVGEYAGQEYAEGMYDEVFASWHADDLTVGIPGGETGAEIVRRVKDELATIVDLHRGETVLVVSHTGAIQMALPQLCSNVASDYCAGRTLSSCDVVEIAADGDGWVLRSWAGQPV